MSKTKDDDEDNEVATKSGLRKIFNRHGLPDEIKEIVLARKIAPAKEEQSNQV